MLLLGFFICFVFREGEYFLYTFAYNPNISLILVPHLGGKEEMSTASYFFHMHSFTLLDQIGQTFLLP